MKTYITLVSLIFLMGCNFETYDNTPYEIIILAGQSNTHAGLVLDRKIDNADKNTFQLGRFSIYDHLIIPANEPLHHHTIQDDKNGFALTFSKLLNDYEKGGNPKLIIPCGSGGSSIPKNWTKDGFFYNDLIDRTKFVIEKFPKSKIKLILWHQGESDVGNPNYEKLLDDFIENIRNDLNNESLPFIVGGMVPFWVSKDAKRIEQQTIIKNTSSRVEKTAYADPETPFTIEKDDNSFDEIHYSAEGQRELGKRYFNAYLSLIKNQN